MPAWLTRARLRRSVLEEQEANQQLQFDLERAQHEIARLKDEVARLKSVDEEVSFLKGLRDELIQRADTAEAETSLTKEALATKEAQLEAVCVRCERACVRAMMCDVSMQARSRKTTDTPRGAVMEY